MSDWYKVYKLSEECGVNTSDTSLVTCNKIKTWIDENFGDILECVVTKTPSSTDDGTTTIACVNVYPTGLNHCCGFYYYSTGSSPYTAIGLKTSVTAVTSAISAAVDGDDATVTTSKFTGNLMMKVIRLKQCYIADFYVRTSYKKKCRLMVADVNGEKVAVVFGKGYFYSSFKNSDNYTHWGSFLYSQNLEKKNLTKFIFPWTDTWIEGFYETDNIVDGNKPYVLNGKTYIDICGGTAYRGLALEVIKGDNDVLYGKSEE